MIRLIISITVKISIDFYIMEGYGFIESILERLEIDQILPLGFRHGITFGELIY